MTNKTCVFIISCQPHKHQWHKFIENMRDNFNYEGFYIVSADPSLPTDYFIYQKFLILKANDYYEGLPDKILKLFQVATNAKEFSDYTHFVKMDDTINLMHNFSFNKLSISMTHDYEGYDINLTPNRYYHINRCKDPIINSRKYTGDVAPYCYGDIYIISRKAALCFNNISPDDIKEEYYEDLMVGKILKLHNILPNINNYILFNAKKSLIYCLA